jgi:serine/threonine protein kinase
LFRRLTGISPFAALTIEEILENNSRCVIQYPEDLWKGVSAEAKELVRLMTQRDPQLRISSAAALAHSWFAKDFRSAAVLSSALENMRKYCAEYIVILTY